MANPIPIPRPYLMMVVLSGIRHQALAGTEDLEEIDRLILESMGKIVFADTCSPLDPPSWPRKSLIARRHIHCLGPMEQSFEKLTFGIASLRASNSDHADVLISFTQWQ